LLRRYLITGLLLWVPLGITLWVLSFLLTSLDQLLLILPEQYQPDVLLGFHIPGLGLVLTVVVLLVTGVISRNFFGHQLVTAWEGLLARIPVVKSIYSSVKQVSDTLLSESGQAFRKALLVEYPREGSWTIAFQTGTPAGRVAQYFAEEHVSVYVPTTPNPTSGFFLMLPRSRVIELEMTVDEALKYIISMGVVVPPDGALPTPEKKLLPGRDPQG
jgi:uncharacterized membrane protein